MNISEFKLALEAAREKQRARPAPRLKADPSAQPKNKPRPESAIERLLQPVLTKAGLDTHQMDQLLAQRQAWQRETFQKEKAAAARNAVEKSKAFQDAIDSGQQAMKYLANLPLDVRFGGLSSLVSLTTPFLIWEWPLDGSLVNSHVESLKSWAKILFDIPAYAFDDDSGTKTMEYSFYFFWENTTGALAVVKSFSVLGLNGDCELSANAGIFSGDKMRLSIDAYLYPLSLWLSVPPGGDIRSLRSLGDPLQHKVVLSELEAQGGHIFGGAGYNSRVFTAASYGMSHGSFGGFQIPGGTTAAFEVNLKISGTWDGNTLPDEIKADFADNNLQYSVACPLVVLQFLTQPPVMA